MLLGIGIAPVFLCVIIVVALVPCRCISCCHSPLFLVIFLADSRCPAQVLDDQTFAALQSVMLFNNVEILHKLQRDPAFFPDLFKKLRTTAPKVAASQTNTPLLCFMYSAKLQFFNTLQTSEVCWNQLSTVVNAQPDKQQGFVILPVEHVLPLPARNQSVTTSFAGSPSAPADTSPAPSGSSGVHCQDICIAKGATNRQFGMYKIVQASFAFVPGCVITLQAEGWHDLVKFLQELCGLARHLQPTTRAELLGQLVSLGLFEVHTSNHVLLYGICQVELGLTRHVRSNRPTSCAATVMWPNHLNAVQQLVCCTASAEHQYW